MTSPGERPELVATELVAVVVAVAGDQPRVLTRGAPGGVGALPSGPLRTEHRSLQAGTRAWVEQQTGRRLGHVEQLYTFADRERLGAHSRVISVSYLGLTQLEAGGAEPGWRQWYDLFPWEDRREPSGVEQGADQIGELLREWAAGTPALADERRARVATAFGLGGEPWAPDLCLQRYELLWEAGLVAEAARAAGRSASSVAPASLSGEAMLHDHRRILATGMARLRAAIGYRPVVFELLPPEFTLGRLQACVEAVSGTRIHTQNFRRQIQQQNLVEETGERTTATGGRPARLFRYRGGVLAERRAVGTKLPRPR